VESLGNKLKAAREAKELTYQYVSRETNISVRYLEALESENFSCFPGEAYVTGFLKNYGDYLGIDTDELFSLYRSLKIQEQPVPMEQLLKDPSPLPKILAGMAITLAVAGLGFGVYYFISRFPRQEEISSPAAREAVEYTLNTDFLERRFYPGDSILVSEEANSYKLVFSNLGDTVTITTPRGPVMLDLGQEVTVDLNNDGFTELRIIAADFVKNSGASGALLRFEQTVRPQVSTPAGALPEPPPAGREAVTAIYSSPNAQPFTLQAAFQGYCLFRYEVLFEPAGPGRNEQYYQRSEEINISARNGIRLGISNAQAVKLQIIIGGRSYPFETGGAGEVIAADIRWIRDEENRFRLALVRLE
jgi:cytoskeletal protein RodZ